MRISITKTIGCCYCSGLKTVMLVDTVMQLGLFVVDSS